MIKRIILAALVLVYAVSASWWYYGSYPTPGPNPRGYNMGYIVQDDTPPLVYRYDGGYIGGSFPAPGGPGAWGVVYNWDSTLSVSNNQTSWIYRVNTAGSVISSFLCPLAGPGDIDLTGDYSIGPTLYLFAAIPAQNKIAAIDPTTGSLLKTYNGPGSYPTACGGQRYSGSYFFVGDAVTHTVYKGGVPFITGIEKPTGIGWHATGNDEYRNLWIVDDATDYVYHYKCDELNAVTPASLGRIKALFK